MTESTILVAIFLDYGSSSKAEDLYRERTGKEIEGNKELIRSDPEFIELVREIGQKNGEDSFNEYGNGTTSVNLYQIPSEMKNFYIIKCHEGFETLILLYSKKAFSDIEKIVSDGSLNSDEKIILINEILKDDKIDKFVNMYPNETY